MYRGKGQSHDEGGHVSLTIHKSVFLFILFTPQFVDISLTPPIVEHYPISQSKVFTPNGMQRTHIVSRDSDRWEYPSRRTHTFLDGKGG